MAEPLFTRNRQGRLVALLLCAALPGVAWAEDAAATRPATVSPLMAPVAATSQPRPVVMPQAKPAATQPATSQPAAKVPPKENPDPALAARKAFEEQAANVLGFWKQYQPDLYKQALLVKEDAKRFEKVIRDAVPEVRLMQELQRRNLPLFEARLQDRELLLESMAVAKQLKEQPQLSADDRVLLEQKLRDTVTREFAIRQKMRALDLAEKAKQIEDLKKKLDDMQKQLEVREANQASEIQKRVNDLMQKTPKLEW